MAMNVGECKWPLKLGLSHRPRVPSKASVTDKKSTHQFESDARNEAPLDGGRLQLESDVCNEVPLDGRRLQFESDACNETPLDGRRLRFEPNACN
jgi:hypothetical protein